MGGGLGGVIGECRDVFQRRTVRRPVGSDTAGRFAGLVSCFLLYRVDGNGFSAEQIKASRPYRKAK